MRTVHPQAARDTVLMSSIAGWIEEIGRTRRGSSVVEACQSEGSVAGDIARMVI